MRLRNFNTGLNTAIDPHLIADSDSVEFVNVDHKLGSLASVKGNTVVKTEVNKYSTFFDAEDRYVSKSAESHFVEYKERLYLTTIGSSPKKIISGTEYSLCITAPTTAPILTVTNGPKDITRTKLTVIGSGGDIEGPVKLQYRFVNKDTSTGLAAPAEEIFTISLASGTVWSVDIECEDTNFSDEVDVYRYFDASWRFVGTITSASFTLTDAVYDISAEEEIPDSFGIDGTIQYALTFVSDVDDAESAPILSSEVDVINGNIVVSSLAISTDPQVLYKRLYRIGGNLTAFTLVDTLDNTTTSYSDSLLDDELQGTLLLTDEGLSTLPNLAYLTEAYGMFFAADKDKLRFTSIGKPWDWREDYYLDFPLPITGIVKTSVGLVILDKYSAFIVTGTGPTTLSQQPLSGNYGCSSHLSIAYIKELALWVNDFGVVLTTSGGIELITEPKLGTVNLSPVNAVSLNMEYFCQLSDGTILSLDLNRKVIRYLDLDTEYLVLAKNKLLGWKDNSLYELMVSSTKLPLTFKSKNFDASSLTTLKGYKNIEIAFSGSFLVQVYVDDELSKEYSISSASFKWVQLKTPDKKGFFFSFRIAGVGVVYEFSFDETSING